MAAIVYNKLKCYIPGLQLQIRWRIYRSNNGRCIRPIVDYKYRDLSRLTCHHARVRLHKNEPPMLLPCYPPYNYIGYVSSRLNRDKIPIRYHNHALILAICPINWYTRARARGVQFRPFSIVLYTHFSPQMSNVGQTEEVSERNIERLNIFFIITVMIDNSINKLENYHVARREK